MIALSDRIDGFEGVGPLLGALCGRCTAISCWKLGQARARIDGGDAGVYDSSRIEVSRPTFASVIVPIPHISPCLEFQTCKQNAIRS